METLSSSKEADQHDIDLPKTTGYTLRKPKTIEEMVEDIIFEIKRKNGICSGLKNPNTRIGFSYKVRTQENKGF